MAATVKSIHKKLSHLCQTYNSKAGVFPCRSFNLGQHTATYPYKDMCNLAQAWCSITPVGTFDPKLGGHLVLKELKLIIEFPASSTILIPSALLTHFHIPIREHETRFSIVQYVAGGLFRWVENGFMTDLEWHKVATASQVEE